MQEEEIEVVSTLALSTATCSSSVWACPTICIPASRAKSLVHRIDSDCGRTQAVDFFETGQRRLGGETAKRQAVRFLLGREQLAACATNSFTTSAVRSLAGLLAFGSSGGTPVVCGSVSCTIAAESRGAEHDDEAMLLDRLDEHFDPRNFHIAEPDRQRLALVGGDASGPAVADPAFRVERAKIAADGHVVRAQVRSRCRSLRAPRGRSRISADHSRTAPNAPARSPARSPA